MHSSVAQRLLRGAQSQDDRWPRALDPGYAKIDDRSLGSLLDFACRFSSLVNHYGPDNEIAGDWVEFFTRDPLVTMASIVAVDADGAERRLARLARRTRSERRRDRKRARFVELFDAMLDLPRSINRWLRGTGWPDAGAATLRMSIEAAMDQSLRAGLQQLRAYDLAAGHALGGPLPIDYSDFIGAWRLDGVTAKASIHDDVSGVEWIDRVLPHLLTAWQPFPAAVSGWAADARPKLVHAFERGGLHEPHVALFVAFAKLFAAAQDAVNDVTTRRTDFYFRRILRDCNRPAVPDTAFVAFTCAPGIEPLAVPIAEGTLLSAGKDASGSGIAFEIQDRMTVTSAALARMFSVRVVSGPLLPGDDGHVVTQRIVTNNVAPGLMVPDGWPTFGSVSDEPAALGFAVSTPVLDLSGGLRAIAVEIGCAPAPEPADLLARLAAATGVAPTTIFDTLMTHAFTLRVSTAGGWHPAGVYAVSRADDRENWTFTLRFELGPDDPAVARFGDSGVAGAAPAVRADLRQMPVTIAGPAGRVSVYPMSLLEGLTITGATVQVDVSGLPGLKVANTVAEVDTSSPFAAFGAVPTAGSYMRIRHAELFSKPVSRLAIGLTWFDLPRHFTGFRGYYRSYVVDANGVLRAGLFDNRAFRGSVSVERPGPWTIAPPGRGGDHYLFRTDARPGPVPEPAAVLAKSTRFDELVVQPLADPGAGYDPSDGSVRVELTAPAYAFGHSIYPQNMLHAVMANTPTDATCDTACREEYGVIAEAGRRLTDLLTEAERTWSLARVLQWLSPLFWLSAIGSGFRSAYVWLTRSLPAHLARRPDATAQSTSIIRIHYADADFRHHKTPPALVGRAYKHTITSRLSLTLRMLLDASHAALSECLTDWQDRFPGREWQRLQTAMTEARMAATADELAALRVLHQQLDDAGSSGDAAAGPAHRALVRCHAFLQAASWVIDCEAGCRGSLRMTYWRAVCANLARCTTALQTLHDTAVKRCKDACMSSQARPTVNPPYLPQIETLVVNYSASGAASFSHLLPHDGYRLSSVVAPEPLTLLPRFAHPANLYLGFSQVTLPQTLHLYVRVGHHEPGRSGPPPVVWDALVGNRWVRLTGAQCADATHGFQRSGIVSLVVPEASGGTVLSSEYRWLRASTAGAADDIPRTIGVLPHAVKAVRHVRAGAGDVTGPLPPYSIAAFVKPNKAIASVIQPAASFGGRPAETDRAFQTRLSERLRHKARAVLGWDYERIVLDRFPVVWKVRAIPARRQSGRELRHAGPGHVQIVIVPGPDCPDVADRLSPMASGDLLAEIEQALRDVSSPFVRLQVVNPVYIRTRVEATVRWRATEDPRACIQRLNADLVEYFSPWRNSGSADGHRTSADVSAFIRSRREVESVTSLELHDDAGACDESASGRCVMTSAAAHDIRTFTDAAVAVVGGY